jgi:D-alanyl-D-alanine carboxypeptidase
MGNTRKRKRKPRLRKDRVAILLIIVIGIPLFISTLLKSCSHQTKPIDDELPTSQQNVSNSNTFSAYEDAIDRLGFKKISVPITEVHNGSLILINSEHEYISGSSNNVNIYENKNDYYGILNTRLVMNKSALEQFNALMKDYYTQYSDGSFTVSSAYRNVAEQELIYEQAVDNNISENKAGYSEHHSGLCVDLIVTPRDEDVQEFSEYTYSSWILENCTKYGFIQRYPESKKSNTGITKPSHLRYVSVPHANYMTENDLCLEEYITMLNDYTFGTKALRYSYDGKDYMIYLCDSNGSDTVDVYVPKDKSYTISGNNINGIIVTVDLSSSTTDTSDTTQTNDDNSDDDTESENENQTESETESVDEEE